MRFQPSENQEEEIERKCFECGKVLYGGKLKFCCAQHKKNYHEREARRKARELKPSATCETCGHTFKPMHSNQKNCGDECSRLSHQKARNASRQRLKLADEARKRKFEEEKRVDPPIVEKPKRPKIHHPAIQRIIDMIKSKRQSVARFEESVGNIDYVGKMQIKEMEDRLKSMGVQL